MSTPTKVSKMKTSELLDTLATIDQDKDTQRYIKISDELQAREPFFEMLNEDSDESGISLLERINDLERQLKNHIHNEKTGGVFIRV